MHLHRACDCYKCKYNEFRKRYMALSTTHENCVQRAHPFTYFFSATFRGTPPARTPISIESRA